MTVKKMTIMAAILLAGVSLGAHDKDATADDAVLAALDAEIAEVSKDGGARSGGKTDELKADALIRSIEAEIAGLDAKDSVGGECEVGNSSAVHSKKQQGRTGNRPSKESKAVVMCARGRGNTKSRAEQVACWNAVFGTLCKYVGTELVEEKSGEVKSLIPKVADDIIDKHEVVEEEEKDGQYSVKVKAWIRKRSLASKFAGIFPGAFLDAGEDVSSSNSSSDSLPDSGSVLPTKDQSVVVVTVTGKGETKDEAKKAAFRAAVERAVGVWVDAESIMKNSELLKDRVNSISNADIKRCEMLDERKESSGLCVCKIKAWVEKMAIAPKFQSVFPTAFKDIGEEAGTIYGHRITSQERAKDAASLMAAALKGVDRMRNWTRLSVAKGKALEEVKKIGNQEVNEVPGKGLYSVRYSIKIDEDAYFKGFLPQFKQVLTKMQEGEAEEDVVLTSGPVSGNLEGRGQYETVDGRVVVKTGGGPCRLPADLQPFCNGGFGDMGHTYFVDPVVLSGFPGTALGGNRGSWVNLEFFMFDQYKGVAKVLDERTFNIWLLDKMNADKTLVRCSAYKVPTSALRAYWKEVYGELNSEYVLGALELRTLKMGRFQEQIEIVLLDEQGEEIAVQIDRVPTEFLTSGDAGGTMAGMVARMDVRGLWKKCNVFHSFFIRPMFARKIGNGSNSSCVYSTEIQRDVYFPLADSQLGRVKKVKVRFVGGRKRR